MVCVIPVHVSNHSLPGDGEFLSMDSPDIQPSYTPTHFLDPTVEGTYPGQILCRPHTGIYRCIQVYTGV